MNYSQMKVSIYYPSDIICGVLDVELPVVERIRHQGRRQAIRGNTQVGEYRQHRSHAHLAVAYDIVYQQYLFHLSRIWLQSY